MAQFARVTCEPKIGPLSFIYIFADCRYSFRFINFDRVRLRELIAPCRLWKGHAGGEISRRGKDRRRRRRTVVEREEGEIAPRNLIIDVGEERDE